MYANDELDSLLKVLLQECIELHQQLESGLLQLEQNPGDQEAVNSIFRAVHTIKGSAGLFDFAAIVTFTHVVESVLADVRDQKQAPDSDLIGLLLAACDVIGVMIDRLIAGRGSLSEEEQRNAATIEIWLQHRLQDTREPAAPAVAATAQAEAEVLPGRAGSGKVWHISLRFGADTFRSGFDPLSILGYVATLGKLANVTSLTEQIEPLAQLDPESCSWGLELDLDSDASREQIVGAFEFVRDDCKVTILPPSCQLQQYVEFIRSMPNQELRLGEILVASGVLSQVELDEALHTQSGDAEIADARKPLGEIVREHAHVDGSVIDAALVKQNQAKVARQRESSHVKVQSEKLDALIDLVGELVIASAGANVVATQHGAAQMIEAASRISELVENIRDSALHLRMVEIGETFNRFNRVVRDVSKELGKDIELQIGGAETELDKTFVEKIGDPLTHLVRNAIDHGIEPAEARLAAGKPAKGMVRLNACHDGPHIVIEISDDGAGLKTERILAKAVEKGLVAANANLSQREIHQLIFEPGFSTADQVTSLSGRGVGMDVVKSSIEALRGAIEIDSRQGEGTTFRIYLPLTLAIIDGFLISLANSFFVIPLDTVVECVEFPAQQFDSGYLKLRGEVLPLLELRSMFDIPGSRARRSSVVVVRTVTTKVGVIVDALHGEQQTVIKPLGRLFGGLRGISGSTILGTGEVALILNVAALVADQTRRSREGEAA